MVKNNYNQIISDVLHFSDFGCSSDNWIGYFERNKRFNKKIANEVVSFFSNYFKDELNDFVIAVSYFVDSKKLNLKAPYKILNEVIKIERELIESGYIVIINEDSYFDNQEEFDEKHLKLCTTFRFFNSDVKILKYLSFIRICDSHIEHSNGYCFFISVKNNVIIYPHGDNSGYGFYSIDNTKENIAHDFLKKISKTENFDSFLCSEGKIKKI
jgi:hypothetical protein